MNKDSKRVAPDVSRRSMLLRGLACATGVATILTIDTNAAMAAKLPQGSVSYRATPNGSKKCGNCVLFQAPNSCKSVAGTISPNGWCSIWRAKS
jgi:hypothetical protein